MQATDRSREEITDQIRFLLRALSDLDTPDMQSRRIVLLEALAVHVEGLMAIDHPVVVQFAQVANA